LIHDFKSSFNNHILKDNQIYMQKIIVAIFGVALFHTSLACDVCGAAVGSPGGEVIPGIFTNFIGFRTQYRSFQTTHIPIFNEDPWQSKEEFWSADLFGRFSPIRQVQILGSLPFNRVNKSELGVNSITQGLGDAVIRVNYLAIDKEENEADRITNLFVGSSLKLPTGRWRVSDHELAIFNRNMLPGTGTFDYGFHLDFIHRKSSWGVMASQVFLVRGTQSNQYAFGNVYQGAISGFYYEKRSKYSMILEIGGNLLSTSSDIDLRFNEVNPYTGGIMVSPFIRGNAFIGNFILIGNLQVPLYQNLAKGYVNNQLTASIALVYQFKN
jgi:hypothetical protein